MNKSTTKCLPVKIHDANDIKMLEHPYFKAFTDDVE